MGRLLPEDVEPRNLSPLALAFVGDGVFEVLVRARLVERTRLVPNRLHAAAVKFVSAKGQYAALEVIAPLLDEAERAVVRRGKNSTKATVAKHATPQEYRASTALESLFGWLYLQNRGARIEELFDVIWNALAPGIIYTGCCPCGSCCSSCSSRCWFCQSCGPGRCCSWRCSPGKNWSCCWPCWKHCWPCLCCWKTCCSRCGRSAFCFPSGLTSLADTIIHREHP